VGNALQGVAAVNQSLGNYQIQIQQASMMREQVRQAQVDTARARLQWEMEYEQYRPTAPKMKKQEDAVDLDWALNHAQSTEIWSGRTLNVLLTNILQSPYATQGPDVALTEKQLAGLNLTDGTTRGNLALVKGGQGKITWTEALQEEPFDAMRESFEKSFAAATRAAEGGEQPDVKTLRAMRTDLKKLQDRLKENVKEIDPTNYIQAQRLLNQLNDQVKGFSDARVVKSLSSDWRRNVRTVADLVAHCKTNGLQFGPATAAGDYPAYTAVYYALRNYLRGMSQGQGQQ
jgi:hypothetical protein